MSNVKLFGCATEAEIAVWKQKYGRVFELKSNNHFGYIKKPGRMELSYAGKVGAENPLLFSEAILTSCWLGGDEKIKSDDDMFLGIAGQLAKVISVAEAEIKEL